MSKSFLVLFFKKEHPSFRLNAWRRAAKAVLWAEYGVLRLWPAAAILAAATGLALLGVVPQGVLPPVIFLAATVAAVTLLPPRVRRMPRRPDAAAAERRLERDSGHRHRPFAVLRDAPALADGTQAAVWGAHRARAEAALVHLRLHLPSAPLSGRDPYALRILAVLLLAAGIVAAGPNAPARLLAAFLPDIGGAAAAAPVLQAWLEPPAYTGMPPIFLPAEGGRVTVPAGAILHVSLTGGRFSPHLSGPDGRIAFATLGDESWQATGKISHGGTLIMSRFFHTVARWDLDVLPNEPPVARFAQAPGRAGKSLETKIPWQASQRWGVAGLIATLRPAGHPDLAPIILPIPLPGTPKDAHGALLSDLSPNPYAGVDMEATLTARDVSGQTGDSDTVHFTLPARAFSNGLARAIADLRRRLALHQETPEAAADDLDALAQTPKAFAGHAGVFLNTVAVAALLRQRDGATHVAEAQRRLWILALALDGALPEMSQEALNDAMAALQRAMQENRQGKLSAAELAQSIEKLRQALQQRLNDMARQAMRDGKLPKFDPAQQHYRMPSIDRMIQAMEKAAREGRTADAEARLQQLENMLQKLDHAKILSPEEARQAEQAAKEAKKQSGAVQDLVQREAGLMDRAQARAPRASPVPLQMQGLFPPPPPDPDQLEAQEESRSQDAQMQRALQQAVEALKGALQGGGGQVPAPLNDASRDMQRATEALTQGREPAARQAEAKTIDDLRKGGQDMQRQREQNAQMAVVPGARDEGEEGADEGTGGEDENGQVDPLGRPLKQGVGGRAADDNSVHVPDEMEQLRSRQIQEELRRRGADRQRPREELNYIDRLLKPF
jgi:uncharacterized protein (TIGR02302 family)